SASLRRLCKGGNASSQSPCSPPDLDRPRRQPTGLLAAKRPYRRPLFSLSRLTSSAALSSRRPRKTGWRISPADVHSVNRTSPTSLGFTQVVTASSFTRTPKGEVDVRSAESLSYKSLRVAWEKPVPTWPT